MCRVGFGRWWLGVSLCWFFLDSLSMGTVMVLIYYCFYSSPGFLGVTGGGLSGVGFQLNRDK